MNKISIQQLDQIINEKFNASFMSNSKWEKLINRLTDQLNEVFINYKLIYSEKIKFTSLDYSDHMPFFIEPILYKELEWIEFPAKYEGYISLDNLKAGKLSYIQNIELIEETISKIGNFETLNNNEGIKLYAYK